MLTALQLPDVELASIHMQTQGREGNYLLAFSNIAHERDKRRIDVEVRFRGHFDEPAPQILARSRPSVITMFNKCYDVVNVMTDRLGLVQNDHM